MPNCRELGYVLGQEQWGKGYMTEAAKAVLRYGFAELGLGLIAVRHHLHNQRSRRVIEKCGFHYEGTMRQYSRRYDGTLLDGCFYVHDRPGVPSPSGGLEKRIKKKGIPWGCPFLLVWEPHCLAMSHPSSSIFCRSLR